MDAQDDTKEKTRPANAPMAKRAYRRPELVEYGDVRELTRGGGHTKKDGKGTKQV
jgi:hypothetical protein